MPRKPWQSQKSAEETAATTLVTTAETVVCALPGISPDAPTPRVLIEGAAQITFGASTTSVQLRVRRGSTVAGTLVGAAFQQTGAATNFIDMGIQVVDNLEGEVATQPYVLTAQQVAATGNGTVQPASITATF